MQQSAEDIISNAITLVQSLNDNTKDDLCATQAKKRQKAVNTILSTLNPQKNLEDSHILQYLPLALIQS